MCRYFLLWYAYLSEGAEETITRTDLQDINKVRVSQRVLLRQGYQALTIYADM